MSFVDETSFYLRPNVVKVLNIY